MEIIIVLTIVGIATAVLARHLVRSFRRGGDCSKCGEAGGCKARSEQHVCGQGPETHT